MKVGWFLVIIFFVVFSTNVQAYNSRLTDEQIEEAIEFGRGHVDLLPLFPGLPVSSDPFERLIRGEEQALAMAKQELAEKEEELLKEAERLAKKEEDLAKLGQEEETSQPKSFSLTMPTIGEMLAASWVPLDQQIEWQKERVEKLKRELEDAITFRRLWEARQGLEWIEVAVSFDNYFARIDSSIQSHPLCVVVINSPFLVVASYAARNSELLNTEAERQVFMNGITRTLDTMYAKDAYLGFIILFNTRYLTHARLRVLDSPVDLVPSSFSDEAWSLDRNYYAFPLSVKDSETGDYIDLSQKEVELLLFTAEGEEFNCYIDLSKVR